MWWKRFLTPGLSTVAVTMVGIGLTVGCSGVARPTQTSAYLLQQREQARVSNLAASRQLISTFLTHVKSDYDAFVEGKRLEAPTIDVLVISGGGDWGAFGAGFLKGWGRIAKSDSMARPQFEIVTGVSTGALIAPFAFLGDDASIDQVVHLYRNPKKDWVKQRWPLFFYPENISFAEVPGLEREVRAAVTPEMVARIAEAGSARILSVNTTNLDDASPRAFELVAEAKSATAAGNLDRVYSIILASAGIPGVFPYREIDGQMYVDGGVTSNITYGGRMDEADSVPAVWQALNPGVPVPKIRYWVIFNNQLYANPAVVRARWPDILTRSLELSTRSATLTALRHLFAIGEISRLKRNADVEIRIVAIPSDWTPPVPGVFKKQTMNSLADLGEKMGENPSSWMTTLPQ